MDDDKNILAKAAGSSVSGKTRSRNALVSFVLANVALGSVFAAQVAPPVILLFLLFPAAIVYGHLARRELRRDPDRASGAGMANYGLFVGYFCLFIALISLYATVRGFRAG